MSCICLSQVKEYKKGLYVDGHERPDVVADRQERFIPQMEQLIQQSVWVQEDTSGNVSICNEEAPQIIVSMDQKAHKSNQRPTWFWGDSEMAALPPKVVTKVFHPIKTLNSHQID